MFTYLILILFYRKAFMLMELGFVYFVRILLSFLFAIVQFWMLSSLHLLFFTLSISVSLLHFYFCFEFTRSLYIYGIILINFALILFSMFSLYATFVCQQMHYNIDQQMFIIFSFGIIILPVPVLFSIYPSRIRCSCVSSSQYSFH